TGGLDRVVDAAEDRYEPIALQPGEHVVTGMACFSADPLNSTLGVVAARPTYHDDHAVQAGPAQRRGARAYILIHLAAHQRIDHRRLEPRVPRATCLGVTGVDVGGGEGHHARIPQDGVKDVGRVFFTHDLGDVVLDDLDRDAYHFDGLRQRDRTDEFTRCGAEHIGGRRRAFL